MPFIQVKSIHKHEKCCLQIQPYHSHVVFLYFTKHLILNLKWWFPLREGRERWGELGSTSVKTTKFLISFMGKQQKANTAQC